ncbi:tetratricopeptide repeat protein [Myxococcus sp. CA056]|uniref:tetratricopeptide repeat protein n=1 Tax=unclassified Myxococcus TaxID=2648731 RepID=UPI00157B88EC|nr:MULTISPECIES: tetratricopeptide repeat protein [unclassified Myxococcus]NTX17053.1 tetratricopeptide repeat protein [Myxococcus sp. CA056]NTX35838.1 tetratricopeptide repeat protein [Myxococcus sp. CA033]
MMIRPPRATSPLLLALVLTLTGTTAVAANAAARTEARRAFERGTRLYDQARYAEAATAFEQAYRQVPNGVVLYNLGQCYEKLGELDKALTSYREYLRLVPKAKDRQGVQNRITNLETRLEAARRPRVTVDSEPSGAQVLLNGQARGQTPWSEPVEVGAHELELTLPDHLSLKRSLEVRVGEPIQLRLVLAPTPVMAADPVPDIVPVVTEEAPSRGRTWTWVAAGATGAATVGAVLLGSIARADARELTTRPHDGADVRRLRDSAQGKSRAANILYGVAGVAAATSVTLFFIEGSF